MQTTDPSFLKPKQAPEPKVKAVKVPKEKEKTVKDTDSSNIKTYTKAKLKNDYDTIIKRIDKLNETISKHDEILKSNKELLSNLQIKKQELDDLKMQI